MHQIRTEVERLLLHLGSTEVLSGMQARIICSCRFRLFDLSLARRRSAARIAAACTLANIAVGLFALQAYKRHSRLRETLYGVKNTGEQE
jgi:hypothetical protein